MFKDISSFVNKPIEKRKRSGLCDFLMNTGTTPLKGCITVNTQKNGNVNYSE